MGAEPLKQEAKAGRQKGKKAAKSAQPAAPNAKQPVSVDTPRAGKASKKAGKSAAEITDASADSGWTQVRLATIMPQLPIRSPANGVVLQASQTCLRQGLRSNKIAPLMSGQSWQCHPILLA